MSSKVQQSVCSDCVTYVKSRIKFNTFNTFNNVMKQVQCEIGECHFDEEMADLHLCLIGQLHTKDVAKDYWHEVKNDNINLEDWCVLWGENGKA